MVISKVNGGTFVTYVPRYMYVGSLDMYIRYVPTWHSRDERHHLFQKRPYVVGVVVVVMVVVSTKVVPDRGSPHQREAERLSSVPALCGMSV